MYYNIKPKSAPKGVIVMCFHLDHIRKYTNCIFYISWFDFFFGNFAREHLENGKKEKITNTKFPCKVQMNQQHYFKKGLNVLLPNDFFSFLNEFFNIFYCKLLK